MRNYVNDGRLVAAAAVSTAIFLGIATAWVNAVSLRAASGSKSRYGGENRPVTRRLQAECGVTGGCATYDACNDGSYTGDCDAPAQYVCDHSLPGLNVCESPPLETMLPCWMSSLDGSLLLSEISIPGTHNTMAKGTSACLQGGSGNYVHTQAWSLRTMLDAGVRALDIRLRHVNDTFTLEHGIMELPYTFDGDVQDVLQTFLAENPTEAILMFYQINDLGPNNRTPEESLQESLDVYPDLWITGSAIPTLEESRAKVVLANDMPREEQNEYQLTTFDGISDKKGLIRDFFLGGGEGTDTTASTASSSSSFRLNYFSGSGIFVFPLTVAAGLRGIFRGTNEVVFEFSDGFLGITIFDFVGEDAIAHVVAQQGTTTPLWDPPDSS